VGIHIPEAGPRRVWKHLFLSPSSLISPLLPRPSRFYQSSRGQMKEVNRVVFGWGQQEPGGQGPGLCLPGFLDAEDYSPVAAV
jgi:hypothetical protein